MQLQRNLREFKGLSEAVIHHLKSTNVPASHFLHGKHCSRPLGPSMYEPSLQGAHDVPLNSVQCLITCIPVGQKMCQLTMLNLLAYLPVAS